MIKTIGLATALAMTVTFAYAQGSGNSSAGTGGPDANMTSGGAMNGPMNSDVNANRDNGMSSGTVGMSRSRPTSEDASTSGAPTAAGVNSRGDMTEPGAVKDGANGR